MASNNIQPLINGKRYGWSSIRANILGRTVTGIDDISYGDNVKKENHMGAGNMPVDRNSDGPYEAKASFTLRDYEIEAIQTAIGPGKRIQDIDMFDIVVVYVDDTNIMVTHVIRNCEFIDNGRQIKQGDSKIAHKCELIVSHIDWK